MQPLENQHGTCPYCGEKITIIIDCSQLPLHFIEDCQVCCRPIVIKAMADENQWLSVEFSTDND